MTPETSCNKCLPKKHCVNLNIDGYRYVYVGNTKKIEVIEENSVESCGGIQVIFQSEETQNSPLVTTHHKPQTKRGTGEIIP